jgi:hypothetical protein
MIRGERDHDGSLPRWSAKAAPAAMAGPESRRAGSSRMSASNFASASCSATNEAILRVGDDDRLAEHCRIGHALERFLERRGLAEQRQELLRPVPRARRGHSRVPAPPHMIKGMTSSAMSDSMIFSEPRHKARDAILDRRRGTKSDVAHQVVDIGVRFPARRRVDRQQFALASYRMPFPASSTT